MSKATQIGWYTLKEDKVFRNTYECAAWYEDVLVKAGKYPVVVYDFRVLKHEDPTFNGKIEGHIGGTYTRMDGTVVSDEFGARFFGVPVGDYDSSKNAGKPASHSMIAYMYEVANSVLNNPDSPWELFADYEARAIHSEWDGEPFTSYGIYKKSAENRINALFEELVPAKGKADTVAGEIIRAVSRIAYCNYNDGDHVGVGYGKETCNPAARYLGEVAGSHVQQAVLDMWGVRDDDRYDKLVAALEEAVLAHLDEHPELKTTPNTEDMWDYIDREEDRDDPEEDEGEEW